MIRILTAGESHGKGLTGIIEGLPAGLELDAAAINSDLKRRQGGYGRGGRMKIESDTVEFIAGVRWGRTIGSPVSLFIANRDHSNWSEGMSPDAAHAGSIPPVTRPRPGHADMAGALKYGHDDVRNILERSSARETAMRVAVGAVMKAYLKAFGITIGGFVRSIGSVEADCNGSLAEMAEAAETSDLRCPDPNAFDAMRALIDKATADGDTLGGVFEVFALGVPLGLGSHAHWDRRLDGRIAQALMCIQAIKGVEVGLGFDAARQPGSLVMDEITSVWPPERGSNNAGGIEGGITNGMPVVARAAMKPIPTLRRPLKSIDLASGKPVEAAYERSDICAVPAASVVGEAMLAMVLAGALSEKFGGDSMDEAHAHYASYLDNLAKRAKRTGSH